MKKEKSCGAVLFRKAKGSILYLLLHYEAGHWDFPKGGQEKGEKEEETAAREIKEETGIKDIKFIEGFNHQIKYNYKYKGALVSKEVSFCAAETKTEEVKISSEHIGFEWFDYKNAMQRLTYRNSKELLEKANSFIVKGDY